MYPYFDKCENLDHDRGRFATLPEEARARYEHPACVFSFGWSHGKETLEAGRPDLAKGSFYANPCFDAPFGEGKAAAAAAAGGGVAGETADAEAVHVAADAVAAAAEEEEEEAAAAAKVEADAAVARYPSFAHPNVWPDADVPGFSRAFKELGRAVVRVGELVARQCDRCVGGGGRGRGGGSCLNWSPRDEGRRGSAWAVPALAVLLVVGLQLMVWSSDGDCRRVPAARRVCKVEGLGAGMHEDLISKLSAVHYNTYMYASSRMGRSST